MTAKVFFTKTFLLNREISKKQGILDRLQDSVTGTSYAMTQEVVSHTRNVHSMEDMIAKIIDLKNELQEAESILADAKAQIRAALTFLVDEDEKTILELRYLGFKKWDEIAEIMQYHDRTVRRKRTEALESLDASRVKFKNLFAQLKLPDDVP